MLFLKTCKKQLNSSFYVKTEYFPGLYLVFIGLFHSKKDDNQYDSYPIVLFLKKTP